MIYLGLWGFFCGFAWGSFCGVIFVGLWVSFCGVCLGFLLVQFFFLFSFSIKLLITYQKKKNFSNERIEVVQLIFAMRDFSDFIFRVAVD